MKCLKSDDYCKWNYLNYHQILDLDYVNVLF